MASRSTTPQSRKRPRPTNASPSEEESDHEDGPRSEIAHGGDCIDTPPVVPRMAMGFVPTFTSPGDLAGVHQSDGRYLAVLFAYTPADYKWVWTVAGNVVPNRERMREIMNDFPVRRITADDVMIFNKAVGTHLHEIPDASDLMALYLIGATPGKVYSTANIAMVVEKRLKAWSGIKQIDTPTLTAGILNVDDAVRSGRFVRRHLGLCAYLAWAHSNSKGCPNMDSMIASLCDQVAMLNAWCELRTAALTYKMITEGKIIGIYDARIFPLAKQFMRLWRERSTFWGEWMKYIGLIWPEDADCFHGRDWDSLYCLAAEYAKQTSGNQMANFQYKHALPEQLVQSLLKTLSGGSSVNLVPLDDVRDSDLPLPDQYDTLRAGPARALNVGELLRTLQSALNPSSSQRSSSL